MKYEKNICYRCHADLKEHWITTPSYYKTSIEALSYAVPIYIGTECPYCKNIVVDYNFNNRGYPYEIIKEIILSYLSEKCICNK